MEEKKIYARTQSFWYRVGLVCASLIVVTLPTLTSANDVFEGEQDTSLRQSLELYGGLVEGLAQGPDGMLYTVVDAPNGVYTSADEGDTWQSVPVGSDFGSGHTVVAADDVNATAFAVLGISLYRTQDAGATWEMIAANDYDLQGLLYKDGLLFVARRDGTIDVSDDLGETFTNYAVSAVTNDRMSAIVASPTANLYYALAGQGTTTTLYQSTNSGQNWTSTGVSGQFDELAVHPTNASYLVLAGNAGAQYTSTGPSGTWIDMNGSAQMPNPNVRGYATILSSGRVYVGPQYTDNNGATWTQIQNDAVSVDSFLRGNLVMFDQDYATNQRIWAQCGRGPCVSNDNGVTWTDKVTGLLGVTIYDIAQDDTKEVVWMAAQSGFAKSENFYSSVSAGTDPTWTYPIYPDAVAGGVSNISLTSAVWVDPDNADVVLTAYDSNLYRSADGGSTWTTLVIDLQSGYRGTTTEIIEDEANGLLYLSYKYLEGSSTQQFGGGVFVSADNGLTWTDTAAPDVPFTALGVDNDGKVLAGMGVEFDLEPTRRGLYLYDGITWTHLSADTAHETYNQLIQDILYIPAADRFVVAAGETDQGGLFTSNDSSGNWADWATMGIGLPTDFWGQALAQDPTGAKAVYVSTARPASTGYIYKCSAATRTTAAGCDLYYTGLVDETFDTLLFDGLVVGSSTGVYSYTSKANITLKQKRQRAGTHRLVAKLKDATTERSLNGRTVRLFAKRKNSSTYTFIRKRVVKKGQANFSMPNRQATMQYQIRFKPRRASDVETYGQTSLKSDVLKL